MRQAEVFMHGIKAGTLIELEKGKNYKFEYKDDYTGDPVSLTMPINRKEYIYDSFPPFFDGLLPEGIQLDALLRIRKIDRYDYFSQILAVGEDMVGAVTIREMP